MKICILSAVNIKHMSLITLYTEFFKQHGIKFDIVYMDKYGEEEEFPAEHIYRFENKINHDLPRWVKVLQYFKFRSYATKILEKNKYDFIIVWNDVAIFMFADYLARKWKGKYCLNVRDYCGEQKKWVFNRFKQVIKKSAFTAISSDGFRSFLPEHDYIRVHSFNHAVLKDFEPRRELQAADQPIRLSFVGNVRFFDMNQKLLDTFAGDQRFELCYFGTNADTLKAYAEEHGIQNARFHDRFPMSDTVKFLGDSDVINNLYGSGKIALDTAVSIKLYHAAYCHMPILVCQNTYMEEITAEYGIGFAVGEIDETLPDRLYEWYRSLDVEQFNASCDRFLEQVKEDNREFYEAVAKTCGVMESL